MTRKEVNKIKKILERIKDPDGHVKECIAVCDKQLAIFDACSGQIKEMYEQDDYPLGY